MSERRVVRWKDIHQGALHSLFHVWTEGRELRWAKKSWEALAKHGLTAYSDETEWTLAIIRLMTLGTIYREFCDLAWDEEYYPEYTIWASELDLNHFRVAQCLGSEFARDSCADEKELLEHGVSELVDRARPEIHKALTAEFGGDSMLFFSLWNTVDYRGDEEDDIDDEDEEDDEKGSGREQDNDTGDGRQEEEQIETKWTEDADIILNNPTPERVRAFEWIREGMPSVR